VPLSVRKVSNYHKSNIEVVAWHFGCNDSDESLMRRTAMSKRNPEEKPNQEQWKKTGDEKKKDPSREQKPKQPQQAVGQQPGQKPQPKPGQQEEKDPNKRRSA